MKQDSTATADILDFHTQHSALTSPGRFTHRYDDLPGPVAELCRVVQGLAIHEYVAEPFYNITIPESRKWESHIRPAETMLERVFGLADQSLIMPRPPKQRLVGVCHHFMLFLVSMLRARGVPARARCGFGAYFNPGFFEDHWVCEYWNEEDERWVLADPQFDEVWRKNLKIRHDVLDVPRDQFLVAADAWTLCRTGRADPAKFGIFKGDLRGFWFIATDLIHDLAALNNVELLPWDVWGAMPQPNTELTSEQLAFFDELARLTSTPEGNFLELRERFQNDQRVRVPPVVFNALLQRQESVE